MIHTHVPTIMRGWSVFLKLPLMTMTSPMLADHSMGTESCSDFGVFSPMYTSTHGAKRNELCPKAGTAYGLELHVCLRRDLTRVNFATGHAYFIGDASLRGFVFFGSQFCVITHECMAVLPPSSFVLCFNKGQYSCVK